MWKVIATKGCGSALVEAAFVLTGTPYEREELDYAGPDRGRLRALNPLGQVPTLIAPDGAVMTESAAVVLHLDEMNPSANLLPHDESRRTALRWLLFLVTAVYPTFTYGDVPAKWVGADASDRLRASTDAHREKLWHQVEHAAHEPWFLGAQFSMLDVYIGIMTHWRPRRAWFAETCPKLAAIAHATDEIPALQPLWKAEFGG